MRKFIGGKQVFQLRRYVEPHCNNPPYCGARTQFKVCCFHCEELQTCLPKWPGGKEYTGGRYPCKFMPIGQDRWCDEVRDWVRKNGFP